MLSGKAGKTRAVLLRSDGHRFTLRREKSVAQLRKGSNSWSSRRLSVWLSSGLLSPSLLACLHDFVHVRRWPNLENIAIRQRRMLRHELYSMIHVPRLKHENAAQLFLGFRIGTIGSCHFAVLPIQGQGGFRRLKRFSTSPVSVGAKMVVVFKTCIEHGVLLALSHAIKFAFIEVSQPSRR